MQELAINYDIITRNAQKNYIILVWQWANWIQIQLLIYLDKQTKTISERNL